MITYRQVKGQELKENEMREYKTADEIREDAKRGNINIYKKLSHMFNENPSMELSAMMSDLALTLVNHYGLTWEDIESLEIA